MRNAGEYDNPSDRVRSSYDGLSRLKDPYLKTLSPVYNLFAEHLCGGYLLMRYNVVNRLEFLEVHITPHSLSLLPGYTWIKMFIPLCIS